MKMEWNLVLLLGLVYLPINGRTLHVNGVWSPSSDFFKVVARFGFEKSNINHKDSTSGYIYGNITSPSHPTETKRRATLVLINRNLLIDLYDKDNQFINVANKSHICSDIIDRIDVATESDKCLDEKETDLIRYVPCPTNKVCEGSNSTAKNLINGYQFTYVIENQNQPSFWYLMLIGCIRDSNNASCQWYDVSEDDIVIDYDIWLVNGHPFKASNNLFTYQFSYEQQDTLLYLVLMMLYLTLTSLQIYAFICQKRRNILVYLFTLSLALHCLSFFFATIHRIVFAQDGQGFQTLHIIADVIKILSSGLFILFVLIIAKGWPVTRSEITAKPLLCMAWIVYMVIEIMLFIWTKKSLDIIKEIDEYHTLPGWFSLGFRVILMMWFLIELRATMMLEQDQSRLRFYLHFGAGIMVWFIHLPIVAIIGLQTSLMWRYKLIIGFTSAANFVAYAIVTYFMWPNRVSYHFLTNPADCDYSEELDYYDENQLQSETFNYYSNPNYTGINCHNNHRPHDNNHLKT